ncbi:MAG: SufE family protein [Verrucomicrobia bacterium]|nr:SufE family protein [Verrucomicrobiota bacterium]
MDDFSDVKKLFQGCLTQQDRYQRIITLGRDLPFMPFEYRTEENIVKGCQSIVYLYSEIDNGKVLYYAFSEALISAGLAALLIKAYAGHAPEFILKSKPSFLEELQILGSLSPSRSNGLANMFLRMQQDAIKFLITV